VGQDERSPETAEEVILLHEGLRVSLSVLRSLQIRRRISISDHAKVV
jgi:hypothetical protein